MKVLLIQISGLHLGYIGCYGNDWVSTPALDQLAAASVVFDQHFADCPSQWPTAWTGIYHYPWLMEKLPTPSGLDIVLAAHGIPVQRVTEGQLTAAHHINPASYHEEIRQALCSSLAGLSRQESWLIWLELPTLLPPWLVGEEFLMHYFRPDEAETSATGESEEDAGDEEDDAEFAEDEQEEGTFAEDEQEEEVMDEEGGLEPGEGGPQAAAAEDPDADDDDDEIPGILWPLLDPPTGMIRDDDSETLERMHLSYAAAVTQSDAYLQTALDQFGDELALDDVLLIVTSDRGLALGEHGLVGDAKPWLYEEMIHLPLLIRLPRAEQAGRRIAALTQPVDLFATILEAFAVPTPLHHGHSLFPLLRGTIAQLRDYACAGLKIDQTAEWVLRTLDWSVLLPDDETGVRRPQLFAKPEDRWEVNNLRQHHLDLAERLERTLGEWAKATTQPEPFRPPPLPEEPKSGDP